jgi:Na+-translocating ferredoxin:NAD+ oxidoreductase subunit G
MKEIARLSVVLTVICLAAGLLLAWVNHLTAQPIEETERRVKMAAIRKVLPPFDNEPDQNIFAAEWNKERWTFYVGRKTNTYAGAAFETRSKKGYGGSITLIAGVNAEGALQAIEILQQKETPGLGAKIQDKAFTSQFRGKSIARTRWALKQDQGDIDSITAATISSRAVVEAVKTGLDAYLEHEERIRATDKH